MTELIAGIVLTMAGFIIRLLAVRALGRDFRLELKCPSRIVTTGIYRWMRHPSYFGSILAVLGLSLIHPAIGIAATAGAFFLARIITEEQVLMHYFGFDYGKYKSDVGIFWPKRKQKG